MQFSDSRSTPDIVSTYEQLIDHSTSDIVTTDQATTDQLISTTLMCSPNMVYANCSTCQATCMDPKGCIKNCTEPEMCVCPNGFLLKEDACVIQEECGCFVRDVGVIAEGAIYISSNCSRRCSCNRGQLDCSNTYRCSHNAVCEVRKDVQQCYCNVGYEGDGVNCTSSPSDCLDVYNTISTKSDVYKIKPTTWQGEPFNVYCNMTDGGGWTETNLVLTMVKISQLKTVTTITGMTVTALLFILKVAVIPIASTVVHGGMPVLLLAVMFTLIVLTVVIAFAGLVFLGIFAT
ncbi:Zonadhesin [Holothuria leucospilota]|uniref:Zonadhesin n=1 Tax=Holothuria leucospilota TaxID=206669 RepID=A0A9Q1H3B2_HOLLE|nr:Zonadhesin [Holothuria leucospilota]